MYKPANPHLHGRINPRSCHPERQESDGGLIDRLGNGVEWIFRHRWGGSARGLRSVAARVEAAESGLRSCSDEALRQRQRELRPLLRRHGFREDLVAGCFAIIREAAARTLGKRHYETQMMGGWALLQGVVAEMATGEGKSLCATLPACTAAFASVPVHIVSVNDYLVSRDAAEMLPLYAFFNLQVGEIVHGMEPSERRKAYHCDITYCNNKELVFDYLKDRLTLGNAGNRGRLHIESLYRPNCRAGSLLQRGLHFAIVDEIDSVLIDEARTPLIISCEKGGSHRLEIFRQALDLAGRLSENEEFTLLPGDFSVALTAKGKGRLQAMGEAAGGVWKSRQAREELVSLALAAIHRYHRDRHYLLADGKVQIIDEYTGRIMPDRSWEGGLHQMIEAKEGCELTGHRETIARITYQRFFRRYLLLSGMTGTAAEVAKELWTVYELQTVKIPTHRQLRRRSLPPRVHRTSEARWQAVVEHVGDLHRRNGQPILVGTRSVEASEHLSRLFAAAGLPHVVLNARQDRDEAEIVSRAGVSGRITIATNMAGRGTDIKLQEGVAEVGGLHVILTEHHDSRRIDRQLFGRCARQGDPGSCIALTSIEDELIRSFLDGEPRLVRDGLLLLRRALGAPVDAWLIRAAQRAAEHRHARTRRETLATDKRLDKMLAFTGRVE